MANNKRKTNIIDTNEAGLINKKLAEKNRSERAKSIGELPLKTYEMSRNNFVGIK